MDVQPAHAQRVLMEGSDYRVGRWDTRVQRVPDQITELVIEARQNTPFNENLQCVRCGHQPLTTVNMQGSLCTSCRGGSIEPTWTKERVEVELLRSLAQGHQVHVALAPRLGMPLGLIEVRRCALLELDEVFGEQIAQKVLGKMSGTREGFAAVRHLAIKGGYGMHNVPHSLISSVLRAWEDTIMPIVIRVDPNSTLMRLCEGLGLEVVPRLQKDRGVLMVGMLRLRPA